jgi:hypothetical protein
MRAIRFSNRSPKTNPFFVVAASIIVQFREEVHKKRDRLELPWLGTDPTNNIPLSVPSLLHEMNAAETCSSPSSRAAFGVGVSVGSIGVDRSQQVVAGKEARPPELQHDGDDDEDHTSMPEPTDEQGRYTAGSSATASASFSIRSYGGCGSTGGAPSPGRRRSMSLASGQPTTLETVVGKAKRAASSLWILLHAQVRKESRRASREHWHIRAPPFLLDDDALTPFGPSLKLLTLSQLFRTAPSWRESAPTRDAWRPR